MRSAAIVLVALALALAGTTFAQTVDDVYPLEPEDGAYTGTRPKFYLGVEGSDPLKLKFRIVLSQDEFETEAAVFDQVEDKNGWAFNILSGNSGAVYRTRRPIPDGTYQWKASAWTGVEWVDGETVYTLHVDGIPPADVDRVEMTVGENGEVVLKWPPVALDANGRPEYVTRYHVYRYERKTHFFNITAFEAGVTSDTRFVDDSVKVEQVPLLFYKVTAEDAAGNHDTKRFVSPPKPKKSE